MSMCTMRLIKGSEPIRPQTSPTPGPSGAAVSYGLRRVAGVSVTGQIYLMGGRRLTWSDWLRLLVEDGVSRRRSFMSRPSIACGSARLAAIPPVRARAAITVAVLCAALSGGFALDVRADRNAIYQPATSRFSQNVSLRAPVATRDGEPSIRVD